MWIDSSKWEHMKKTIIIYGILAILILAFGVIGGLRNTKSDDSGHWHTIFRNQSRFFQTWVFIGK